MEARVSLTKTWLPVSAAHSYGRDTAQVTTLNKTLNTLFLLAIFGAP